VKWRYKIPIVIVLYTLGVFAYFAVWRVAIAYSFGSFGSSVSSGQGTDQSIQVGASASLIVFRYGWIPVYWSDLGDLIPFHYAYLVCSGIFSGVVLTVSRLIGRRRGGEQE
jgi:hypothetical protein